MSKNVSRKISVPSLLERNKWTSLSDTPWDDDTLLEIVQRYCDAQDHARNYRLRASAKRKLLTERLETLAKASGMTVDEYLEIESANLSEEAE